MVGVSASVNLPLHHKVLKFSSGTGSAGWSQKKGRETVVVVVVMVNHGVVYVVDRAWLTVVCQGCSHQLSPGCDGTCH